MNKFQLARYLDSTNLKPTTEKIEIIKLANEALEYNFAVVMTLPYYLPLISPILKGSDVLPATVISFPYGSDTTDMKVDSFIKSADLGAREIDTVINLPALKSKDYEYLENEANALAELSHDTGICLKVIIECCFLNNEEKIQVCRILSDAGVNYIKTSTGTADWGAKVEDIRLIRDTATANIKIKAAGGIRDTKTALEMIKAGADRIGTSNAKAIVDGLED